jgi:hypothetical protein
MQVTRQWHQPMVVEKFGLFAYTNDPQRPLSSRKVHTFRQAEKAHQRQNRICT